MEKLFNITLQNRKILYKFLTNTPRELLLKIPAGHRNNIWWNIAHVVVTQQLLVYKLSKRKMMVDAELVDKFKKGSVPDGKATDAEIKQIETLLFSTLETTEDDYKNGLFKEYTAYTTSVNIAMGSVEDAIAFNVFHEGIHLGSILGLQKALAK